MNQFCVTFYSEFEIEFELIKLSIADIINQITAIISFLEKKIKELHNWLKDFIFESIEEEIYFFKELKPKLISKLIYYKAILNIKCRIPADKKSKRKFYEKELNKIYQYSKENKELYQYFRSRSCYNDEDYFVRNNQKRKMGDECSLMYHDTRICTTHNYKIAEIMSNDLLSVYIENKIEEMDRSCSISHPLSNSNLNWTGSKIDLVELVYALHHQKVFNGGNTDIKEIAVSVGKMFNIDIEENIYRSYLDIKNRKSGHTKFLNSLSDSLNNKILSEDS